ncbi:MAG TPA: aminoglycoside phosphotransferase family protein, partial [Roseiflexaceae bacterium]|nr:aminoglycoside phosphotransferase family protein [Roseiflexaceae bacterium]
PAGNNRMPPTSDLLHLINQQHATAFVLLDRFTTGEQGAFALVDAQDARFVLKWAPDLGMLMRYQRARQVTDQLRALGYPAPDYVLVGCSADAAYAIQRALPGQPMKQLPQALISEFLTLNERQAEQASSEATTWPEPVVDPVLLGGDGFCLLEPMQAYSTTTAQMLQRVQAIVQRYAGQLAPQTDIVHYDCNPANVLASATGITGVIDWDGWCAGDRMFDVATMLFYSYADMAVRTCLWQTILKHSGPEAGAVYLGHLIHRQIDWSIRHHTAEAIEHWLRIAATILGDLVAYR